MAKGEERVHKVDGVLMRANPKGFGRNLALLFMAKKWSLKVWNQS
jgi:hypothetical protein